MREIYLRSPGERNIAKIAGTISPFEAYTKGLEWMGYTKERAQEMLADEIKKSKGLFSQAT